MKAEAKKKNTAKDKLIKRIADTELKADTIKLLNMILDLDKREKTKTIKN